LKVGEEGEISADKIIDCVGQKQDLDTDTSTISRKKHIKVIVLSFAATKTLSEIYSAQNPYENHFQKAICYQRYHAYSWFVAKAHYTHKFACLTTVKNVKFIYAS
jgi:hypothetical protein